MKRKTIEQGMIQPTIIIVIALSLLVALFGGFSVWAYVSYSNLKGDFDSKVSDTTAKATLDQSTKDEADFAKREKEPMRQFAGPADYGRLSFDYPKTWSVYEANDVSKGGGVTYAAYLHPKVVPPITTTQKFALRVTIEQLTYDKAVASYDKLIKAGSLKSSVYSDGTHTGTRLEGNFSKDIIGSAVLIKMRDRTLTVRTDGEAFKADFEALLKTLSFNE